MRFHEELNPKLFNGLELKPEVKEKLNEIAEAFKEYLDIPEDAILDERITGSSASYNYTEYSDLDLHLIIDYEKVHEDCPLVEGYLWSYKSQFNANHDISIYGIPVEVYAEDSKQEAISNGVYSLMEDRWLKEPKKIPPTDNDEDVQAKYQELKDAIDRCDDSEVANELLDKIYTMRKSGLAEVGEFSTENMAFKLLRNDGSIDKLKKLKKEKVDKQLSLESYNEEMYIDEKDVPPLHDYAIIFKYQEPWPDGKLAYRAIMKLTTGSSYRMQSWSYTKEGMINIVKKQWPYADIVDKTNELVSESYNKENVEKLETLEDLKNYFDTGLETIDCEITYFPNESTQKVLRITSASPKINREWLKEVSNGKIKLVGVKQHKNRFGGWIKKYDRFYGYVDNMNELQEALNTNKLKEDYEDDYEDIPEEMHKERYVTYFETQEGRQKYTIYHVYTDSTDDFYNELCDKRDNQLGMYNSYKELKDALKERAEKIAAKQGWTVKSIENLGEDDEYYRKRNRLESMKESLKDEYKQAFDLLIRGENIVSTLDIDFGKQFVKDVESLYEIKSFKLKLRKAKELLRHIQGYLVDEQYNDYNAEIDKFMNNSKNESIKEGFNKGDKVQLKRKNNKIGIVKSIFNGDKDKNGKDIKYLDVEFEDGKNNGSYPSQYFRKITEALNTNILKELVQKYPYHTVGTIKQMAKELEDLTDIGCVLEIRESNSWHSCYTIFKKKAINKWESTYICDGKLIEEQTWIATTYDVAENITSEDNRVNNITIKQETLESTKSIKETTMLLNKLNKAINEALEQDYDKVSAQDIRRWFESKTKYKKQNDPEFYVRSAVKQFPQLKGKEEELRKNIEKQKAKNKPWYPYMDAVKDTLKDINAFQECINEALENELQVGDTVVLRGSQPLQLKRRGTIKKLNKETAVVEFPEVPEQDLMTREDTYYIDELQKVNESVDEEKQVLDAFKSVKNSFFNNDNIYITAESLYDLIMDKYPLPYTKDEFINILQKSGVNFYTIDQSDINEFIENYEETLQDYGISIEEVQDLNGLTYYGSVDAETVMLDILEM